MRFLRNVDGVAAMYSGMVLQQCVCYFKPGIAAAGPGRPLRQLGSFHLPLVKSGISTAAPLRSIDNWEQWFNTL